MGWSFRAPRLGRLALAALGGVSEATGCSGHTTAGDPPSAGGAGPASHTSVGPSGPATGSGGSTGSATASAGNGGAGAGGSGPASSSASGCGSPLYTCHCVGQEPPICGGSYDSDYCI